VQLNVAEREITALRSEEEKNRRLRAAREEGAARLAEERRAFERAQDEERLAMQVFES
jgi:hypothetical protein